MATARTQARPNVYGSGGLMPQPYIDRSATGRGRTNNRLIRGPKVDVVPMYGLEVDPAPSADIHTSLSVSKALSYKWTHDQNTASQGLVVLPKGHIVSFNNNGLLDYADWDVRGGNYAQTQYLNGMSYLNLFRPVADRLAANRPGIATRGYFELPVFASYADAVAANHRWGAIIAYNGEIKPGDLMRVCGSTKEGVLSVGWLTNKQNTAGAKITAATQAADRAFCQVYEFDDGPTFEGLLNWVQFDNPFEFEFGKGMWTGDPADDGYADYEGNKRRYWRDPSSPTGFSYGPNAAGEGMYPYDPRLQDPLFRDAMGIPNLTDGANWQSWQHDKISSTTGTATTLVFKLYYYRFAGIGQALNLAGTGAFVDEGDLLVEPVGDPLVPSTADSFTTWIQAEACWNIGSAIASCVDDGVGTITITVTGLTPSTPGTSVDCFFRAQGQVAGVPVNIDISRCIGVARFAMMVR